MKRCIPLTICSCSFYPFAVKLQSGLERCRLLPRTRRPRPTPSATGADDRGGCSPTRGRFHFGPVSQPVQRDAGQKRRRNPGQARRRLAAVVLRQRRHAARLLPGRRGHGLRHGHRQRRRALGRHVLWHDDRRPVGQEGRVRPHLEVDQDLHVPEGRAVPGLLCLALQAERRKACTPTRPRTARNGS